MSRFDKILSATIVIILSLGLSGTITMFLTNAVDTEESEQMDISARTYTPVVKVEYYNIPLDEDIQEHVMTLCKWYDLDERIVFAMVERESQFDIGAVGDNGGSIGLMQIQPRWHQERMDRLSCNDLTNPFQNVTVGVDYLAELVAMDRGIEWALMAYNGGFAYASERVGRGELSEYASYVLERAEQLERRVVV